MHGVDGKRSRTGALPVLLGRVKNPLGVFLLLVALFSVGGFVLLASEVAENETLKFDKAVLLSMREPGHPDDPTGSGVVEVVARDITALGGVTVLTLVALVSFGAAVFSGKAKLGCAALAAVVLGTAASGFLKSGYNRPRPDLVEHGVNVYNASFPSGHSMMSAVVYLTLAILLARMQERRAVRVFVVGVAVLITVLVGISRVYLGVHWPTDVLAGWTLGAAWAIACWLVAMRIDPQILR